MAQNEACEPVTPPAAPEVKPGVRKGSGTSLISYNPAMSAEAWEFLFMMLALKIPIVYLGIVVWYAIKAEPDSEPGAEHEDFSIWRPWRRPTGPRPRRGGP